MKRLNTQSPDLQTEFKALLAFGTAQNPGIDRIVADIYTDVQKRGDSALIEYINRFSGTSTQTITDLILTQDDLQAAFERLQSEIQTTLKTAAARAGNYHQRQKAEPWTYEDRDGTLLGQQIILLDRVDIYVPDGKTAYPSSVIMNAMPTRVAGMKKTITVIPTPEGRRNDIILTVAFVVGVTKVFTVGDVRAVATLAYGIESVPQVDKVIGPGNAFVAATKRHMLGVVGIDVVAGPSEVLVVADGTTSTDWVTMGLFNQAEHDEIAQTVLIGTLQPYLDEVQTAMNRLTETMPHHDIIKTSLDSGGAMILVEDLNETCEIADYVSPEHLGLPVENPQEWARRIRHTGAISMGCYTGGSLGDYCAGPNHVLPTSRTARFPPPLGTYDFQKRSNLIQVSEQGAQKLGKITSALAHGESLTAHARSAELRLKD